MDPWSNVVGDQVNNGTKSSINPGHAVINLDVTEAEENGKYMDNRTIADCLDDFGNETTHHGVRFVTNPKYNVFRRLVWAVVILGADSYLSFNIVTSFLRHCNYDVNTLVSVEYATESLEFPAVTLCNYNQWRKSKADKESLALIEAIYARFEPDLSINWTQYEHILVEPTSVPGEPISDFKEMILDSTHQIQDMLINCSWRGGEYCDWRNVTTTLTDWGVCYTFNSPEDSSQILKINQPGTNNGLFLRMNVEQDEYMAGEQEAAGFKVLLHPQGVRPLLKELGFAVSPGFETLVTVNYQTVTNLPHPFTDCKGDSDTFLTYSNKYTVPLCNHECKVKYVVDNCGCKDYRYPGNATICNPKEIVECIYLYEAKFYSDNIQCDCPKSCYAEKYSASTSVAYFPNDYIAGQLGPLLNVSEGWMRKNVLDLRIFFEELSYSSVKQKEAYGKNDLISDIGGNMGLMAGISIITVLETFDFISNTMWKKFCRK